MPKQKRVKFTDQTPMPWGLHEGTPMMDVPGSYLLWLFKQPWIRDWPDLHDYLVSNQTVLMAEEEDDGPTDGFQTYQDYETYGR